MRHIAFSVLIGVLIIGPTVMVLAQTAPTLDERVAALETRVAALEGTPAPPATSTPTRPPATATATLTPTPASSGQRLLVPAYFPPGADWNRLTTTARPGDIAIMNIDRGPGAAQDAWQRTYAAQMVTAQARMTVIGYVRTGFGNRSLTSVKADIDRWYAWSTPDGIFLDEGWQFPDKATYYQQARDYIKSKSGRGTLVVLNLGAYPQYEGIMQRADVVNLVEQSCSWYASTAYAMPLWVANYPPSRIAHLLYDCAAAGQPQAAVTLTRQRGAGYVYITNLAPPVDVWGALPPPLYWSAGLSAMRSP